MANLKFLHADGLELIISQDSAISYPTHNHVSVYTLGFLLNGSIELINNFTRKTYYSGDSYIIFPYETHSLKAKTCYTFLNLCLSVKWLKENNLKKCSNDIASFLHISLKQPFLENKIIQAVSDFIDIYPHICHQPLKTVQALKAQLEKSPEKQYTLNEMAADVSMSKYNLIRTFKKEIGLTPHQFQIQNRIRKAQHLLMTSQSVTEVALAMGFYDQSHFIRHFEKIVGISPIVYKHSCEKIV